MMFILIPTYHGDKFMQSYKIISWEIYKPVLVKFAKDQLIKNNKYVLSFKNDYSVVNILQFVNRTVCHKILRN